MPHFIHFTSLLVTRQSLIIAYQSLRLKIDDQRMKKYEVKT